jgi:hypothetical protein
MPATLMKEQNTHTSYDATRVQSKPTQAILARYTADITLRQLFCQFVAPNLPGGLVFLPVTLATSFGYSPSRGNGRALLKTPVEG